MSDLESTALWQEFAAKATDKQRVMVRDLAQNAMARLDLVRDTFPTYTLHNHVHALNVVNRMGDLLGARVKDLSAMEGAMLLLSACLHDIGMVCTSDERENLQFEEQFGEFLNAHPAAFVQLQESKTPTEDLAEWYCRWVHPRRVHRYIASLDAGQLDWGSVSLDRNLGLLCESHGWDASRLLHHSAELSTDFLGQADLPFCALILRLADILDFDNSRSPDEVYKYLGLAKRNSNRESQSDVEWLKHLASDGFIFPPPVARQERYPLKLIAGPDHPAVEYDIRAFLDVIESEINNCHSLLHHCSNRWRDVRLPLRIERDGIIGRGYKYGEYRFTLEQDQILDLLMGENLYSDPYAFIRELVQNSIDTTRHRVVYEQSRGNANYQPTPIQLSTWTDDDGYQWVRIDDRGMGMNEEVITKFLLKVGKSYYRSPEFQAEMLHYKTEKAATFTPISRFGIGMLSCFIVGDRLELTTKRVADHAYNAQALRMSMNGIRSFYTLHIESQGHRAFPIPNSHGKQETYRKGEDYGTSIAVRLDARRDHSRFDLAETLKRYVVCSPVPIECAGKRVGGDCQAILERPWIRPVDEPLTSKEKGKIERTFGIKLTSPPRVRLVPLSLTEHSADPNLLGQMLIGYINFVPEDESNMQLLRERVCNYKLELEHEQDTTRRLTVKLTCSNYSPRRHYLNKSDRRVCKIDLTRVIKSLPQDERDRINLLADNQPHWLSHNGIAIPDDAGDLDTLEVRAPVKYGLVLCNVGLRDALRPEVSLSRDELKNLSWNIYSSLSLALIRALRQLGLRQVPETGVDFFEETIGQTRFPLGTILDDPLLQNDGPWFREPIIITDKGPKSVVEIRAGLHTGTSFELKNFETVIGGSDGFLDCCRSALVQIGLNIRLMTKEEQIIVDQVQGIVTHEALRLFPPLFFIPYEGSSTLRLKDYPLNINHHFSLWLIQNANSLSKSHPGYLDTLRKELSNYSALKDEIVAERIVLAVNKILDRLRAGRGQIRPPEGLELTIADFGL